MSLLSDEEVFGSSGLLSDEDVFGPAPAAPRASQADVRRAEPVEPPRRRGALPRVRAEAIGYSNEPPLLERPQADPFADPMLNRQFVEDFRANVVGALAPEDRMPFLRAVSEKTDIQGRAAKELLARAEAEARVWRPEDLRRQAERVPQPGPTPAGGGAPPRGRVEIPDPTPNFTEMAQGVAPAEVARRRAAEMGALRQQAEGRMFDGTSGRERNTRTVARDALLTFEEGVTNAKALIANSIDPSSEWARSLRQEAQALQQRMSPEERASRDIFQNQIDDAQKEGELRALAATVVLTLTDPMAATREALRQAPIIAGMVGMTAAGAGLGAGAFALAGAARPALQVANAIRGGALAAGATQAGGLAGGAIAGGMAAGGDAAGSTYEHLMDKAKVSDELLLQSPDAKALMAEGKSLDEARAIIAKQRARIAQSIATPLGMALGPLGLEAVIARRAAGRAAGSRSAAFGLELGGEVGDEVATQVAGNIGVRGVDASVPLMQGTGQAAGSALATALPTATIAAAAARPMTQPPAQPQGPTAAEAAAARGFGPRAPLPPRVEDMPTRPLTPEELQAVAPAPATQNAGTTPAAPQAASPAPGRTADGAPGAAPRAATQEPAPSAAVRPSAIGVGRVRQGALAQAAGRALGVTDVDQPDLADLAAAPAGAAAGRRDLPGGSGGTVGPDAPSARGVGGDSAAPAAGGAADSALAAAGGPGSALSAQRAKAGASRVDLANLVAAATRPNAQGNRAYAVYRAVDDGEAQTLSQLVGVDLRGFAHGIDESAVRHILNRHGTEKAAVEADRNQVPVTAADLELLPRLTDPRAADRVTPSFNASNGLRAIEYTTRVNGHYFVVEEVRTGRNRLSVVSMRKVRAAPAASAGAPAAVPLTSETFGARPTGTVAQDAPRLQNRDRRDAAYVRQMQAIAAQPDPLRLSFSRDLASGAPVVLADGAQPTLFGNESVVTTAEGRRIPVRYAVVDAEALLPSNRADGTANEGYQGGAAGRLRVVAGNGRAAGLQLAYRLGTTTRYKQGIAEDAALHGVSAERIARMSEPVLVRVMSPADVTANIGDESNVSGVADKSAREMAQDDARRLDLSALEFDDDGNVTPQALAQFVNAMPLSEQTGMRNADGTATRQAQDRLLAATFWAAYEDDALLALAAQAIDPEARVVMAALAQAAAPMMRLRDAGELDIRPIVSQAAQLAVAARRRGMNAQQAAQQLDLAADPAVAVVLGLFARNSRSARRIGQALRDAAQFAYDEATKPGDDMFGAVPRATRADVLRRLDDDTRGQEGLEVGGGREPAGRDAGRAQGTDARGTAGAGRAEGAERAAGQGGTEGGAGAAVQGAGAADRLTDAQAFVPAPGGGIDFGEITPEMGQAMRRQAAPIRLQQGVQNADGTGYGLAHIEANHGAQIRSAGFEDVPAFIAHVARNFNEVLQATKGRQLLVAVTTGRRDVMFVQLEPAGNGDFYRVNSAFPASRDYLEKQEIKGAKVLWSGSEPRSAAAGRQPPYAGATETRPDDGAPIAESQGAESVSPPRTFRAAGPDPLLGAANVDDAARVFPSRGAALAAAAQAGLVGRVEVQPVDGGFALAPRIEDASASVAGEDASETRRLNAQFASAGWRNADGTPARATLVPDASASRPFRQLQAAVAAVFGIRVLDVRGIDANGVQFGRRAFVNTGYADTPGLLIGITGHEALHWLETNDKPAAQRLHATIGQYLRDGAVQRQLEFENRNLLPGEQPVSAERAHSEVLANLNGAMWLDPAFWQRVAELDNGSTLRRVVYAFLRRAAQVARVIRGSELDALRYVQDVAAVREAVAQVWAGRGAGQPRQQATAAGARGAVMSRGARDGGNIEVQRLDSPLPDGRQWVAIFSEGGNERITFHASEADARAAGQAVLGADAGREGGGGPTAGTRQAPAEGANADGSAPRVRNASYRLADGRQPGLGLTDRASALLGRREAEAITSKREVDRRVEQGVLTQLPERRRFCFQYAAATAINGVGDMVIGVSQDAMGDRVWHAVVMRDGYTYDPTMRQWFAPGVYEATGFSPRLSLSPQQVMEYLRAHDGMAPDALNQGLGAEPSLSRRDSGSAEQGPRAARRVAAGRGFARFDQLGEGTGSAQQGLRDAASLMNMPMATTAIEDAALPPFAPAAMNPDTGAIHWNPGYHGLSRAQWAQAMAEELLHAADLAGVRASIVAGSTRLAPGGDLRAEAQAVFSAGQGLADWLSYPLDQRLGLSDARIRVELFARLGTLYHGDAQRMRRALPLAYEAFDVLFGTTQLGPDSYLLRDVRGAGARADRAGGGQGRPDAGADAGRGRGDQQRRAGDGLEQLRDAIARVFDADRAGTGVGGTGPSLSRRDSGTRGTASLFDDDGPLFSQAGAAPDPVEPLLTAQTPDDLRQRAERQARATEEARRRSAQRDARLRQEADERENRARADATRADFQLGQSAEQQMAGQEDLFAAPLRGAMLSRRARPAPEASFAATERAYGGRAAYDRARADGRTRLTYGQWVQVRTPEFKRWFGAWDAAANAEMDRDAATVEQARAAATQFVGQPLENLATGMQAAVSRNTLGKMTSASAQQKSTSAADHALAVANADKLFTHAMLDRSHSDARGEPTIAAIHRYVAPMRTSAGRLVAVKMTVKETTGPSEPNPLYSIETLEIENPPSVLSRANPDGTGIRPQAGFSDSVQVLLAAVNGEGVSKVVDRDTGEPQVVYHGSADFRPEAVPLGEAVFDPTRGGGEGSFFTPYRERALRYSNGRDDGITAAFLSIKRPDSWIGDRERLIREGYDGARDGSTGAWAAFYPEQIKSATGNRGTFDPGEADIRLSRRARPDAERNDIRAAALLQGPPVAVLRGDEAPQDGGMAALRDWATGLYAALPTPNMALHPDLGSVMLDERSVPSSSSHGMTRHKAAAFAAVPAVIERGALVAHGVDGNVDSYFVSAPVDIAGRADVVTVLIKRDPKVQRMYLHSVATKEFLLRPLDSRADAGEASGRTGKLTAGEVASVLRRLLEVDLAAAGGSVGDDIRLSRRAQQPARAPTAAELSKAADDMAQDGYNRLAGRFVTLRDPDGSARQAPAAQALREIDRRADLARRILDCLA